MTAVFILCSENVCSFRSRASVSFHVNQSFWCHRPDGWWLPNY